jgi:DNA-binding NarL/FixJ family response regulator
MRRPNGTDFFLPRSTQAIVPAAIGTAPGIISVALVIASRLERLGWSIVLEQQKDIRLAGQFCRCREAIAWLEASSPDVVLIDEILLTPKDCETLVRFAAQNRTRFLLVAPHPVEPALAGSPYSFAFDCLLKGLSAEELLAAIRRQARAGIAQRAFGGQ